MKSLPRHDEEASMTNAEFAAEAALAQEAVNAAKRQRQRILDEWALLKCPYQVGDEIEVPDGIRSGTPALVTETKVEPDGLPNYRWVVSYLSVKKPTWHYYFTEPVKAGPAEHQSPHT
jgi:hypothetical protein